jgi:hypothetical protein
MAPAAMKVEHSAAASRFACLELGRDPTMDRTLQVPRNHGKNSILKVLFRQAQLSFPSGNT